MWAFVLDTRFRGALALFVLLTLAYLPSVELRATRAASITGDEPFYLMTTVSLIEDGDLDLRQQYARESWRAFFDHAQGLWTQSVPLADGRVLSPHEPLLALYTVPGYLAGGLRGAQVQLLLSAAATFALGYVLVASETRAPLLAWLATAAVGLSATAFVYSTEVYPELPAALCLVLLLLVLRTVRAPAPSPLEGEGWGEGAPALLAPVPARSGIPKALLVCALLTTLMWFGMKYSPLGAALGLAYLVRADRDGRVAFLTASTLSAVAYAALHLHWYSALTAYNYNTVYEGASTLQVLGWHIKDTTARAYRLWGLFIDARFGLGRWAPVLLLVPPALPLLWPRSETRGGIGRTVLVLVLIQLAVASFVAITMMGFWFAGRMLVVVLPLFALPLTELLLRAPRWLRALGAGLAAYSCLVTALLARAVERREVALAVDPWVMRAAPFEVLTPLFPDYRTWGAHTVLTTVGWLLLAALAFAASLGAAGFHLDMRRARRTLHLSRSSAPYDSLRGVQ